MTQQIAVMNRDLDTQNQRTLLRPRSPDQSLETQSTFQSQLILIK